MPIYLPNPLISLARAALRVPDRFITAVAGDPITINGRTLDRSIQFMLRVMPASTGAKGQSVKSRRRLTELNGSVGTPRLRAVSVTDRVIAGPAGDLTIRVYRPHDLPEEPPATVYFHGGGWVVGSLNSHDGPCRAIAVASCSVVVSVDYRLAPEHPFPAAVDDALATYEWVAGNPGELATRPGQVAVMGDSAGGSLAAVVAQLSRSRPVGPPKVQALLYPSVDLNIDTGSDDPVGEGFLLSLADIEWFRTHYLQPDTASQRNDPRASPLLGDLTGLPPALIWTAGFDPLREDGARYARALRDAGNEVRYHCYDDQVHAFVSIGIAPGGMLRIAEIGRALGRALRA